ncbi:MAG: choice-of-anchor Q domain-containing protein [Dehalococcoidia bacterium]
MSALSAKAFFGLTAVALALVSTGAPHVSAETIVLNVTNTIDLENAFDTINGNITQDYELRLQAGHYKPSAPLGVDGAANREVTIRPADGVLDPVKISGSNAHRVFDILSGRVLMKDITIADGAASTSGAALLVDEFGDVTLEFCLLIDNASDVAGGAIHVRKGGGLGLLGSTIQGGGVTGDTGPGGAILNEGSAAINGSTIEDVDSPEGTLANRPFLDGDADPDVGIEESTITGNGPDENLPSPARSQGHVAADAAMVNDGTATIRNSTISHNRSLAGGAGIAALGGTVTVHNTIVASNTGGNCEEDGGVIVSDGFNLEDANTCHFNKSSDKRNTPAGLGALRDNGGATRTRLPQASSAALNTGGGTATVDQRGMRRPQGPRRDRGAVEVGFCFGARETKVGTVGKDTINGTTGVDVIFGLAGNDKLVGRAGNDRLCGDAGTDQLLGGTGGADKCDGGPPATGDTQSSCETKVNIP